MSTTQNYKITASGCDDATEVIVGLTRKEADTIRMVAKQITEASEYDCQPRLYIVEETP